MTVAALQELQGYIGKRESLGAGQGMSPIGDRASMTWADSMSRGPTLQPRSLSGELRRLADDDAERWSGHWDTWRSLGCDRRPQTPSVADRSDATEPCALAKPDLGPSRNGTKETGSADSLLRTRYLVSQAVLT